MYSYLHETDSQVSIGRHNTGDNTLKVAIILVSGVPRKIACWAHQVTDSPRASVAGSEGQVGSHAWRTRVPYHHTCSATRTISR